MDVCIDTEAITEGIVSIGSIISGLEDLIAVIQSRLHTAHDDFTSINFDRAAVSVNDATKSCNIMNAKLRATKDYLNKLVAHIEAYNKLKF